MICFAVYRAEEPGPMDPDEGMSAICVALFGEAEEAIAEARAHLLEGYSVSIDIGAVSDAGWDALEEVPDDFVFTRAGLTTDASPASDDAVREDAH